MVLSEAFSELALSETVCFDGFDDPLAFYKSIRNESINGFLVSPHIGGGTSDIEFDILTGINTRHFRGVPYSFTMVTRTFPGFVNVLNKAGFESLALHPGAGWFYNRQNTYLLLGFGDFMDQNQFNRGDTKGGYISERQTIDAILREYKNRSNDPFFLKAITIQNHGPYHGKYNAEINFNIQQNQQGEDLSLSDKDALANYFVGLKDSDEGLKRLVEFFKTEEEPVVLVYYGDHLPSLPLSVYETLIPETEGVGDSLIRFNRVPFLIWANEAGRVKLDARHFETALPADRTISSLYLGAALLKMLGLDELDAYIAFINWLLPLYPVILENTYRYREGPFMVYDPDTNPDLAKYKSWAYHRIMNP
jgi:hypothetical protein